MCVCDFSAGALGSRWGRGIAAALARSLLTLARSLLTLGSRWGRGIAAAAAHAVHSRREHKASRPLHLQARERSRAFHLAQQS